MQLNSVSKIQYPKGTRIWSINWEKSGLTFYLPHSFSEKSALYV